MQEKDSRSLTFRACGLLIAAERGSAGLSQTKAAVGLGVNRGAFAKLETGSQEIFMDQLRDLTHVLDTDLGRLLPEPSTIGTNNLRSTMPGAPVPAVDELFMILLNDNAKKEGSYLPSHGIKSSRKRSK